MSKHVWASLDKADRNFMLHIGPLELLIFYTYRWRIIVYLFSLRIVIK